MSSLKRAIYEKLPPLGRSLACLVPYSWLAGRHYTRTLALCRRLEFASREEIERVEEQLLSETLQFAARCVPAYASFRRDAERYRGYEAIRSFPLVTKADIQRDFERYVPTCIGEIPHRIATTGGTTGRSFNFYEDDSTYAREMAFIHHVWGRVGYTPRSRRATFRGVAFRKIGPTRFWQHNPIHNELQFSPYHISEENLRYYVNEFNRYRPEFLYGFPSAIDVLAEFVLRQDLSSVLPPIKAALLISEGCTPIQRKRIEKAFRTRVFMIYGHSERLILGAECEKSSVYHHCPAYGHLEMLDEAGQPCREGEIGELVGTGFGNRSLPLIRYRTDDRARREPAECECGRHGPRFSAVDGRWSVEWLVAKSGARVSATAFYLHHCLVDLFEHVARYQYYQREPGRVEIRMVVSPEFTDADAKKLVDAHVKKTVGEFAFEVKIVPDLPLTRLGKQRRVVSELIDAAMDQGAPGNCQAAALAEDRGS